MKTNVNADVVLFSSGLGGAAAYWTPQVEAFSKHFQIVTYDHRGTGADRSKLPVGYCIADMADEAADLLIRLGVESCHFVGHALGAAVGLEFARRHPARVKKLGLMNGWAKMDAHTERCFEARLNILEHCGVAAYLRAQAIFLYPAAWASYHADRLAIEDRDGVAHFQGVHNLHTRLAALRAFDATGYLSEINAEVLALSARDDVLVPWTASARIADCLSNGRFASIAEGGHACNVTNPDACNDLLIDFLAS